MCTRVRVRMQSHTQVITVVKFFRRESVIHVVDTDKVTDVMKAFHAQNQLIAIVVENAQPAAVREEEESATEEKEGGATPAAHPGLVRVMAAAACVRCAARCEARGCCDAWRRVRSRVSRSAA